MFPIPWNFPLRKKNGNLVNIGDAIDAGSEIPEHDETDAGKVLSVDENGDLEWSDKVEDLSDSLDTLSDTVDSLDNSVDAVSNDVDVLAKNGAVNILPITAKSQTINGVTFTVNDDGSVTIDGTATQTTEFPIINKIITLKAGNYILSTKNNIPSNVNFSIYIIGKGWTHITDDANSIEFSKDSDIDISICRFWIADGTTVTDLTAYPMIADANYSGDYVPYAKTNLELTEEDVPGFKARVDILGAKNFLRNDAVSTTESGVTFSVRDDGTILVSGTATADVTLTIRDDLYLPDGEYTMSLEPIAANQYAEIDVSIKSADDSEVLETFKLGNPQLFPTWEIEHTFTYSTATAGKIIIVLKVWDTTVMQDAVIKPMIRLASDSDMTYQPYAMTNRELTENNNIKTAFVSVPATYHGGSVANINFEKRNGVVHAWWAGGTPTFPAQATAYEIGDIPEGFIPVQVQTGYGIDLNSFTKGMYLQLRTNGKIYIFGYNTGTGGTVNALVSLVYFA